MTSTTMEKKGYKQTELGLIPEDWEAVRLDDVLEELIDYRGRAPNKVDFGIPLITTRNVKEGFLDFSSKEYINNYGEWMDRGMPQAGDLIFTMEAPLGNVALFPRGEYAIAQRLVVMRGKSNLLVNYFLLYFFLSPIGSTQIQALSTGSTALGIKQSTLRKVPIPLPPLEEQKKIAEILSIWDQGIDKLSGLIERKKHLKKGLMQKLLTGRVRFEEFVIKQGFQDTELGLIPEDWEVLRLGDVFDFLKTESFSREALTKNKQEGEIFNIHYGDIHSTYKKELLDFESEERIPLIKNEIDLHNNLVFLSDGDLIVADASEDYEGVGVCIELKNVKDKKVTGGLHTFALRDKSTKTVMGFRTYIFRTPEVSLSLKKIATGISVYGISKTNLSNLQIPLPPLEEQKKIAEILSTQDKEINDLEKKLELFKQQKKGLMQILLTGRVRV